MEMADYWLEEKQLVHKLFKVLVPRYEHHHTSYTKLYRAPKPPYPGDQHPKAVLELKGHPYPSLLPDSSLNKNLIHNVLLEEAKKAYRNKKYAEFAAKIEAVGDELGSVNLNSDNINNVETTKQI